MLQAWQLKLVPLEDVPTKGNDKLGGKATLSQQTPAKEYGCDLPFKLPAPDRNADDVVLALCAGSGANGAAPADSRSYPSHNACASADDMFRTSKNRSHGGLLTASHTWPLVRTFLADKMFCTSNRSQQVTPGLQRVGFGQQHFLYPWKVTRMCCC